MDNWPAWKMVPKTAEEIAADHAAEKAYVGDVRWNPALGLGLGVGAVCGVAVYFITLSVLPWAYQNITVIK
jgi:AAT family amino acid transporter